MPSKQNPPKPSADELALIQQQKNMLAQQQGLLAQVQAEMNRPKSEAELRAEETQRLYDERLQRALRGDVPLDPNLEREIEQERSATEAGLMRALGPNFMASTPGQEGMRRFGEDVASRRFRAREAFIAGTEAPSFERYSLGQNLAEQQFRRPLLASQSYGGASQDINPLLSYYTNERYTPFNIAEQRRAQTLRGLGQLAGAGVNFYTGGIAMPRAIRSLGGRGGLGIPYTGNPMYTGNIG